MENKTNKEQIQEDNKAFKINQKEENKQNMNQPNHSQIRVLLNNKYDSALLEELNNSKTKSWRIDITNPTLEEEMENKIKNNINIKENEDKLNNEKEKEEVDKIDRFKDFDEILILEENKDKKRKNHSKEKIINSEKFGKIPKPIEKRKCENINNVNKSLIQENSNFNKNSSTISELNKYIGNNEKNYEDFEDKKNNFNENNEYNKNIAINNHGKSDNLSEVINENSNTNEYNDNKYKNINLEYSDDKKSYEEKDVQNNIKNNYERVKNDKKAIDNLYNNFIDAFDKNNEKEPNFNNINRNLFEKNNIKTPNFINNNKNHQLKVSKSCNIRKNYRSKKSNNENNLIYPNKSQNIKRSLIYDTNTINIQLSIKRKTKSAKDIKKHMSYYLMDKKVKSPKNEINNLVQLINNYSVKRNCHQIGLNSFLSYQISFNQNNLKNHIKDINTQYNIFKNSFKEKIRKRMNKINGNSKYKSNKTKPKTKYINLEFFEESKQDNIFGKTAKDFYTTKNKLFDFQEKKDIGDNKSSFFKSQNNFYNEQNKKDNTNNYLFKTFSTNFYQNHKSIFSFDSDEYKSLDNFKEKNEIFGNKFSYNTNHITKFEFESDNKLSNKIFNNTKNNIAPIMKSSYSYNSIFNNRLDSINKNSYSYIHNNNYNNRNYRRYLMNRKNSIFSSNLYL